MPQQLIYDVGMHLGEDTSFYLSRGHKVIGVEANPNLMAPLRERFADDLASGRLTIVDRAIARQSGKVPFAVNEVSLWGSLDSRYIERSEHFGCTSKYIEVQAVTLSEVIKEYGMPYYLKVDIEGFELVCIDDLRHFDAKPQYVSIESEVTFGDVSIETALKELSLLSSFGYSRFKYINQRKLQEIAAKKLFSEGTPVTYVHEEGSSGPFGEETPGAWLDKERAEQQARAIVTRHNWTGYGGKHARKFWMRVLLRIGRSMGMPKSDWYDLHAKFSG